MTEQELIERMETVHKRMLEYIDEVVDFGIEEGKPLNYQAIVNTFFIKEIVLMQEKIDSLNRVVKAFTVE